MFSVVSPRFLLQDRLNFSEVVINDFKTTVLDPLLTSRGGVEPIVHVFIHTSRPCDRDGPASQLGSSACATPESRDQLASRLVSAFPASVVKNIIVQPVPTQRMRRNCRDGAAAGWTHGHYAQYWRYLGHRGLATCV